jgi:hypothetical protein
LRAYGSIEYAQAAARQFAAGARQEFENAYADASPGVDLEFLRALLDYMIDRDG